MRQHDALPSCTSDYLPAAETTFLQQQLSVLYQQPPVLHQRPPSCNSSYQSCTSNYLPAPAATSPAPVTTSPDYQTCTRKPVLHQRLVPAPTTSSWMFWTGICHTIFWLWFTIIKFGFSKQSPCFVIFASFIVNILKYPQKYIDASIKKNTNP